MHIEYDPDYDILTIEGVKYSGGIFREFGLGMTHHDEVFRIVKLKEGQLTISKVRDAEIRRRFDELSGVDNTGQFYAEGVPGPENAGKMRYFVGTPNGGRRKITLEEAKEVCPFAFPK